MIVVITGPTGVGKTELSLAVAEHYCTEIISGDAMQVYKGMDIGTAKVNKEERAAIRHHMIDILSPQEAFSVANYQKAVREHIETMYTAGKLPLIVGGTGFYIKSVLHDFDFTDTKRDFTYEKKLEALNDETLHEKLVELDPDAAKTLHPHNRKRVLQALRRAESGQLKSASTNQDKALYDYLIIVLDMEREKLYHRIETRVDAMFAQGLLEEARKIYDENPAYTAANAIGYKELFGYFAGSYDLPEAKRLIKRNTRRYAKRQLTYFRNQFDAKIIDVDAVNQQHLVASVIALIDKHK